MIDRCNYKKCGIVSKSKIIKASENKSEFSIHNPRQVKVCKVTVDGCLIKGDIKRCDYLFHIEDNKEDLVIYVELKGRDVASAISQLKSTIGFCKTMHESNKRLAYVVARSCPKSSPTSQRDKLAFKRATNVDLRWASARYIYKC